MINELEKTQIINSYRHEVEEAYEYAKKFESKRIFRDLNNAIEEYSKVLGMEHIIGIIDGELLRELNIAYRKTLQFIEKQVSSGKNKMQGCVL
jgi:hypothetical protein